MFNLSPAIPSRSDLDWCWFLRKEGRIGEALERVLHDIGVMQPGGWSFWAPSPLTDTGAPVEMMFTANQSDLSLRTEIDDPANDPKTRVGRACALITELGGSPPPPVLRDVIGAVQSTAKLRFGAWLGLRHDNHGLATTLYAEVPAPATDLSGLPSFGQVLPTVQGLGDSTTVTMIGYDTSSGKVTVFCETHLSPAVAIPELVQPAGVSAEPLLQDIEQMIQAGAMPTYTPAKLGFSYTLNGADAAPTLTLEVSAKALFGTDAVIEQKVKDYPGDHSDAYSALMDQHVLAPKGKTHHGKISLSARKDAYPILSIGVAAPWICPFDIV